MLNNIKNIRRKSFSRGAAALLLVLGVSAALLLMARSLADIGFRDLDTITAENCGDKALLAAESCVEEALKRIQLNASFTADSLEFAVGGAYCVFTSGGGKISATGSSEGCSRKIEAEYNDSGQSLELTKWGEAAE